MAVQQYGEKLDYGISANAKQTVSVAGVTIYPTNVRVTKGGDMKEYRGPAGTIISIVIPETFDELSVEGLVSASGKGAISSVEKGKPCTITGLNVTVRSGGSLRLTDFSVQWSNEEASKVSATVKQYPDISGS